MNLLKELFEMLTYNTIVLLIIIAIAAFGNVLIFLKLYIPGTSIRERLKISTLSLMTVGTLSLLSVTQVAVYGISVSDTSVKSVKEVVGRGTPIIKSNSDLTNKTMEWTVFTGDPDNKAEYTDKSFYKTYKTDDKTKNVIDSYEATLPIDKLMSSLDSKLGESKE